MGFWYEKLMLAVQSSRPVTKFTEDFDFIAMNEKFKKDEVWGHLGKGNKFDSKDREGDEKVSDEDDIPDDDDTQLSTLEVKVRFSILCHYVAKSSSVRKKETFFFFFGFLLHYN